MSSHFGEQELLKHVNWQQLNVTVNDIVDVANIHRKWDANLYRLTFADGTQRILKTFPHSEASSHRPTEIIVYELLSELGVPTLAALTSNNAVLMEDLQTSTDWRLCTAEDMQSESVGCALGHWYRTLHEAGRRFVASDDHHQQTLPKEHKTVTKEAILALADTDIPTPTVGWERVAEDVSLITAAIDRQPLTLNYNDFHWTNAAVSRSQPTSAACLFDFHLFGIGLAYSDIRNVASSLPEPAMSAFLAAYGDTSKDENTLDLPIAILAAILFGLQLPKRPSWTTELTEQISTGLFEDQLHEAVVVAKQM